MIPGIGQQMQSLGSSIDEKENMKKVKSQLCMIDSMT
jgi:signal recognition particle GTPase